MRLALVMAVLVLLAAAAPAADAQRRVPQGFYGVMWDHDIANAPFETQAEQWDLMASSGVESVRTVFDWSAAQPDGRRSPVSFVETDALVRLAAEHRVTLLPVVIYAPRWARAFRHRFTSPPRKRADYVTYLAALIDRYGPTGTFWLDNPDLPVRPVREWQIWNEPHLTTYWNAPERGTYGYLKAYPPLLRASYRTIKVLDPGAKVVLGGITQKAWDEIELLYRRGIRPWFDVAALQAFPQTVSRAVRATELFRQAMRRRGDRRKPIYLTEVTWPASKGRTRGIKYQRQETPNGMATKLSGVYRRMAAERRGLGVDRVFWYTWASPYGRGGSIFNYAGLQRFSGGKFVAQPALGAYRRSARRYQGCIKLSTGACEP